MKVTFIGIGLMGKPIAINLIKAGVDVTVVNRSQGKIQELVALGARNGGTPSEGSADADVVILCLQGEDIVELVLNGDNGVLSSVKRPASRARSLIAKPPDQRAKVVVFRCSAGGSITPLSVAKFRSASNSACGNRCASSCFLSKKNFLYITLRIIDHDASRNPLGRPDIVC